MKPKYIVKNKGLAGVVVDTTAISYVDPERKFLSYRGYPILELTTHCSFEEVAYLLWYGELPDKKELKNFRKLERKERELSTKSLQLIKDCVLKRAHPMDILRTVISNLGAVSTQKHTDNRQVVISLFARIPIIVSAIYRYKKGQVLISARNDLSFVENFFFMCFNRVPVQEIIKAFTVSMILYAEHGFNASTFTARVVASTLSDMYSAVTAAIGALRGTLHGGANEQVMRMLHEIGTPKRVKRWLEKKLKEKQKIVGFGHRIYFQGDSRVPILREYLTELSKSRRIKWVQIITILESEMARRKNIYSNLDLVSAPLYSLMGFPSEMFTPLFVMSRITGWTAHIMEQYSDNKLIRPQSYYIGPHQRQVVPLYKR